MGINIEKPEKDLQLTQDEYNRLLKAYQDAYMFYAGTPPTFETFARRKLDEEAHPEKYFSMEYKT